MARDYQKEYTAAQKRDKIVAVHLPVALAEEFKAKCENDAITQNAFLRLCVESYTHNLIRADNGNIVTNP